MNGIKLSLNQDLSKLQEKLGPQEIGQFLHSINDLPRLAEVLDPSRNRLKVDLFYHYNNYGCSDDRIFNWDRISTILTYGGLSRSDKLILLNRECLAQWPGLLTIEAGSLRFLLSVLPEINPLLLVTSHNCDGHLVTNVVTGSFYRWRALIDSAAMSRDLNFTGAVDLLFKNGVVSPEEFEASAHSSLIGPKAIDACFQSSTNQEDNQKCSNFILSVDQYYNNFSARDLFFWSLNIGTAVKFDVRVRVILYVKGHFNKLITACQSDYMRKVIKSISVTIFEFVKTGKINKKSILSVFSAIFTKQTAAGDISEDANFFAVEFYKWLEWNIEPFGIDEEFLNDFVLKQIILKSISYQKKSKNSDYFLNFFVEKRQFCKLKQFKRFLQRNYDPFRPSEELLKTFRRVSWINGCDGGFKMTQVFKSFFDYDLRVSLLRKASFSHFDQYENSSGIEIFVEEGSSFSMSVFSGVYESLLKHISLIYPFKVNVRAAGLMRNFIKDSLDLETVLQSFWNILGDYSNAFMTFDRDDRADVDLDYNVEFVPNPWTHPNILLAAGCVMTLAFLHGIKLDGWRMNKTIFKSAFKIDITSVFDSKDETPFEEDDFLMFYTINDYLNAIEAADDSLIEDSLEYLIKLNESLKPHTKTALKNYRANLLAKNEYVYYTFSTDSDQVWSSKLFHFLENSGGNLSDILNSSESFSSALNPKVLAEMNLTTTAIEEEIEKMTKVSEEEVSERDAARIQIYSLYLGLQPLTRFLKSDEAYDVIFKNRFIV